MKKIITWLLVLLLLTFAMVGCKEQKFTECESCGKRANCYKVTWVVKSDNHKESHYVCSKQCEDVLNAIMTLGGAVKK